MTELARNRITPLGGRHQRRLVSRLGLNSKWQQYQMYASVWSLRSDRYHYKILESPDPRAPWTPTGGSAPNPRYRLAIPRSPYQPAAPTWNYFRRPWFYPLARITLILRVEPYWEATKISDDVVVRRRAPAHCSCDFRRVDEERKQTLSHCNCCLQIRRIWIWLMTVGPYVGNIGYTCSMYQTHVTRSNTTLV